MCSSRQSKVRKDVPYGKSFNAYKIGMQVPYRLHSEIQEKIIYNQLRRDIQDIIRDLCKWKGVEIIDLKSTTREIQSSMLCFSCKSNCVIQQSYKNQLDITHNLPMTEFLQLDLSMNLC